MPRQCPLVSYQTKKANKKNKTRTKRIKARMGLEKMHP